jgi:hypothetical protein
MSDKYIVVDMETEGILCESITPSIAQAVSLGFINSTIKVLPMSYSVFKERYGHYDFNQHKVYYTHQNMQVNIMNPNIVDDKWVDSKQLAHTRNNFHTAWEARCKQFLQNRNHDFHTLGVLDGYLWNQIEKCDPPNNHYTQAIQEWASISEISAAAAYQELKMRSESIALQYIRNHAVYQKYVHLINKEKTEKEMMIVFNRGMEHLYGRVQI